MGLGQAGCDESLRERPGVTESVNELLNAFDALAKAERHVAAAEVLRRVLQDEAGDVQEDALTTAAEELFLELDARENEDA